MIRICKSLSRTSAFVVAFLVGGLAYADTDAAAPKPFKAEYRAQYGFFEVGRYHLRLSMDEDGTYRYTSRAEPSNFVSFFTGRKLKELSKGRWGSHGPEPRLYRRSTKKSDGWEAEEVRFGEEDSRFPADALDPASMVLALMHDAGADALRDKYTLVDEDSDVRSYGITDHGWHEVEAAGEKWRARKLERKGGNPKYHLTVYLAPELGWLPVQIDYTDKGKTFEMYLVDVDGRG